jgi:hypothetical protein
VDRCTGFRRRAEDALGPLVVTERIEQDGHRPQPNPPGTKGAGSSIIEEDFYARWQNHEDRS